MSNESEQPRFEARESTKPGLWYVVEADEGHCAVAYGLTEPVARQLASDLNAATVNAKIAKRAKEWAESRKALVDAEQALDNIIELCAGRAYEVNARLDIDDARKAYEAAASALLAAVKESQ
jgi:hypothetical protein